MSKKKNKTKTWVEVFGSERRDWNGINPVTRVIPDKRAKKREKAERAGRDYDDN